MSKALVLSGGGAKGSWQFGVIKALAELGNLSDVQAIYGTSVGALNGCYPLIGIEKLESLWRGIKSTSDVLCKNWWIEFLWKDGQYSTKPLKKSIDQHIQGSSPINIYACVCDLNEGKSIFANSNSMAIEAFRKMVLASASIPFAMESVDGRFVDGGVRDQTPLAKAIADGHKEIHVIGTNPIRDNPDPWSGSWPYILSTGLRAVDILEHEVFVNDLDRCIRNHANVNIVKYMPKEIFMDTLDFNPEKINRAIEAGYNEVKG